MLSKAVRYGAIATLIGLGVAACGARSSLDNPASDADRTATAESGQGKKEGDAPKPHKGFVLDGLIR